MGQVADGTVVGVYVDREHLSGLLSNGGLLPGRQVLEALPDGVIILDPRSIVLWVNPAARHWSAVEDPFGQPLGILFQEPNSADVLTPALQQAMAGRCPIPVTVRVAIGHENRYLRFHIAPVLVADTQSGEPQAAGMVLVVRDATAEVHQRQRLLAIHRAGSQLADLRTDEVAQMTLEERKAILRENILHNTQDLLHYDVFEVRALDRVSKELKPLLAHGMTDEACHRQLIASETDHGVTGYVAATKSSYICRDSTTDPHYLEGCTGGRSSMTVPLVWSDEVIGTFNVESPLVAAFDDADLQFLEIFAHDVAQALHTLDLLVAEQASTTAKNVERIHAAVAMPIDAILNDAVMLMELQRAAAEIDPALRERLWRIVSHARDIKEEIRKIGREMTPSTAVPVVAEEPLSEKLAGLRVLVVDPEHAQREQAHQMLGRFGCIVETAPDGVKALEMARGGHYRAIVTEMQLPDMSGYEFFDRLRDVLAEVPIVFMKAFGWDCTHTEVKARRAGVRSFVAKPFKRQQIRDALEGLESIPGRVTESPGLPPRAR
jgi:CheY-like chemotaxis protein